MNRRQSSRARRRGGGEFGVIPRRQETGEEILVVVGPAGAPLYTFTDIRNATAEAPNSTAPTPDPAVPWSNGSRVLVAERSVSVRPGAAWG